MTPKTRFAAVALLLTGSLGVLSLRPPATVQVPGPTAKRETPGAAVPMPGSTVPQGEVALASTALLNPREAPEAPEGHSPELRHPHPITPQHERIYRENTLTFALDGAVDVEDAPGIRRLLAIYRQEFPEDSLLTQQGYEIIADCLDRPGVGTRAAAQRFYDTEIASALRRHVRRHCLGG